MAEAFEYPVSEWNGIIPMPDVDDEGKLEFIYRMFNRVDQRDCDNLDALGYKLPSMGTGDSVTFDGKTYVCESVGWSRA